MIGSDVTITMAVTSPQRLSNRIDRYITLFGACRLIWIVWFATAIPFWGGAHFPEETTSGHRFSIKIIQWSNG
jgi:hypothetical protein